MAKDRFASLREMKIGGSRDQGSPNEQAPPPEPPPTTMVVQQPVPAPTLPPTSTLASTAVAPTPSNGAKPEGRAREIPKRNHPDYQQINTYIRKPIHQLVWLELVKQSPRGQFDELIENLLKQWLKGKGITTSLDGKAI